MTKDYSKWNRLDFELSALLEAKRNIPWSVKRAIWPYFVGGIVYLASPLLFSALSPSGLPPIAGVSNESELIQLLSIPFFAVFVWRLREVHYCIGRARALQEYVNERLAKGEKPSGSEAA